MVRCEKAQVVRHRELAAGNRDAYLPDLAMSVLNLAIRMIDAERRGESHACATEAQAMFHELAMRFPARFTDEAERADKLVAYVVSR